MSSMTLKLVYGGEKRRARVPDTSKFNFQALVELVSASFPELAPPAVIQYVDDEEEVITVATDMELAEAIRVAEEEGRKVLRITVTSAAATAAPAPVATDESKTAAPPAPKTAAPPAPPAPKGAAPAPPAASTTADDLPPLNFHALMAQAAPLLMDPTTRAAVFAALAQPRPRALAQRISQAVMTGESPAGTLGEALADGTAMALLLDIAARAPAAAPIVNTLLPYVGEGAARDKLVARLNAGDRCHNAGMVAQLLSQLGGRGLGSVLAGTFAADLRAAEPSAPATAGAGAGAGAGSSDAADGDAADDDDAASGDVIHFRVICDGCGANPITGVRYKCAVCDDFDLCEECEASTSHDASHPFLKIKTPAAAPAAIMTVLRDGGNADTAKNWRRGCRRAWRRGGGRWRCHRGNKRQQQQQQKPKPAPRPKSPQEQEDEDLVAALRMSMQDMETPRASAPAAPAPTTSQPAAPTPPARSQPPATTPASYNARFVSHVGPAPRASIPKGTAFTKTWRMRNEGETAWPEGCRLVHVGAYSLGGAPEGVPVPAAAVREFVNISVDLVAPEQPGRYVSYWRLITPSGVRFGHRVWADIVIDEPAAAVEQEEPTAAASGDAAPAPAPAATEDDSSPPVAAVEDDADATDASSVSAPSVEPVANPSVVDDTSGAGAGDDNTADDDATAPDATSVCPYPQQLQALMDMGFPADLATAALVASNGNVPAAMESLLN